MRVFVTGATGFVGSAIVNELLQAGHQVLGLTRSEEGAKQLKAAGADVHYGNLEDLESLKHGASLADGVIHTAFNHDFTRFSASCEHDRHVIAALGSALEGSNRPMLITSGTALVATPGRAATEADDPTLTAAQFPRIATQEAAVALMEKGLNVSMVRLPPSTHGQGDHGFIPMLIAIARDKGMAAYAGEGNNLWPAVHRLDAARLYRLAIEKAIPGMRYHAVQDEGVPMRQIAEVIGKRLQVPVKYLTPEAAKEHFGWFNHFASLDAPATALITMEKLGWKPTQISLLEDLDQDYYFE